MESEKILKKKTLRKNENNDLRDMVRSTSKSEVRRVKVSLHRKCFRESSLNNSIADSLAIYTGFVTAIEFHSVLR